MCNKPVLESISLGEALRQAREDIGLSQQKVADCLCLRLFIIKSIEEGYIDSLQITSTFLRGYIRSYARLVGIVDEEVVLNFFRALDSKISSKLITTRSRLFLRLYNIYKKQFLYFIIYVVVVIVLVMFFVLHKNFYKKSRCINFNMFNTLSVCSNDFLISKEINTNFPVIEVGFLFDKNFGLFENLLQEFSYFSYCNMEKKFNLLFINNDFIIDYYNSMSRDSNRLMLNFTSDCWVKILDATGKILYVGTKYSGNMLNISGEIPYTLTIGAPKYIQIIYQGRQIHLDQFIRSNKVARLTIPMELVR